MTFCSTLLKQKYLFFKGREIVHVNVAPLYFDGSTVF